MHRPVALLHRLRLSRNPRAQAAASTRIRSRSKLPRPYIARLICFSLVTFPSATPLL
jgi:hypothetical protein